MYLKIYAIFHKKVYILNFQEQSFFSYPIYPCLYILYIAPINLSNHNNFQFFPPQNVSYVIRYLVVLIKRGYT